MRVREEKACLLKRGAEPFVSPYSKRILTRKSLTGLLLLKKNPFKAHLIGGNSVLKQPCRKGIRESPLKPFVLCGARAKKRPANPFGSTGL